MGSGVKVGELYGELRLDKRQFDKALGQAEKDSKGFASRVGGGLASAGATFLKFGAVATLAVGAAGYASANFASDLNEAMNKVKVVFETSGDRLITWADDSAVKLGMSKTAALSALGTYGNLFRAMKIGLPASEEMSMGLVTLAADLASFNNMDPTEVLDKLRAGLVGETEPLRTLGVNLNQAKLEMRAMELGLWDGIGAIDAGAKAQAAYSLIMEETALAQGDFARTSDGMANQQRILAATFSDTMAAVGAAFMPLIQELLPHLTEGLQVFAVWVQDNMPMIRTVIETVMAGIGFAIDFVATVILPALFAAFDWIVTNVIPPVVAIFSSVEKDALPALGGAFDFISNTVLPLLGDVFDWVVKNVMPPVQSIFETFTNVILPGLGKAFAIVQQWISDNWPLISKVVDKVAAAVKTAFEIIAAIIKAVAPVIVWIGEHVFPLVGAAASVLLEVIDLVFGNIGKIWDNTAKAAAEIAGAIEDAWEGMTGFFKGLWTGIGNAIKGGINFVIGLVNGMIDTLNGIQIHIPGVDLGPLGTVAKFDWNGLNLGRIPYLATGVRNFPGGWAMVGERGPELAHFPKGTDVYSNDDSRDMMRGGRGGDTYNIYGVQPGDVEREVMRANRRLAVEWNLS